jgi:hypothetical protein
VLEAIGAITSARHTYLSCRGEVTFATLSQKIWSAAATFPVQSHFPLARVLHEYGVLRLIDATTDAASGANTTASAAAAEIVDGGQVEAGGMKVGLTLQATTSTHAAQPMRNLGTLVVKCWWMEEFEHASDIRRYQRHSPPYCDSDHL